MPTPLHIAVVVASTRAGRFAPVVADWTVRQVRRRTDAEVDVVDLATVDLPAHHPVDPRAVCGPFLDRLARADAFIVVTPEYNHSFPAPLKHAIDLADDQFRAKPVTFVTYGGISGGLRAAEQLRPILAEMQAATMRDVVSFAEPWDAFGPDGDPVAPDAPTAAADVMLDQLCWWAVALRAARRASVATGGTHALFVSHRALPGRRDDVVAVWQEWLRPLVEANDEHVAYAYCLADDPDVVKVFQLYTSADAAARFLELPGYAAYLERVLPLVAAPPVLETAVPVWRK